MEDGSKTYSENKNQQQPKLSNEIEWNDFKYSETRSLNIILKTIKKAKDNSDNPVKFLKNLYQLVFNSLGFIISFIFLTCIPIAMIAIGFHQREECKIDFRIPIWLIVLGIIGLITGLTRVLMSAYIFVKNRNQESKEEEPCTYTCFFCLICFFMSIWFVLGNVWVFSKYTLVQHINPDLQTYCHVICYNFAFWSIIFFWILVILISFFLIGLILYFVIGLIINRFMN